MSQSVVIDAATRYSPMKFTKSTQQRSQNYTPTNRLNHSKLFTDKYFCHYSNAIYMGGMDSYKKRGHGLLFMDNGACAITYHSHDNMVDHNIVFRDKSMTLMTIKTNKSKNLVYRTGPYLITANFNSRGFVEGIGYLVDFENQKLFKLGYYQSKVDKKQQIKDQRILGNIFSKTTYTDIINDQQIIESLNLNFNISSEIRCARQSQKKNSGSSSQADKGDIFTIGMMDKIISQQKSGSKKEKKQLHSLNGLNFKVKIFLDPKNFDVILIQRGYFEGQKMQKFGEKHFENGNYYIGEFKNNMFDGYGMLIHPEERKWTYGVYKKGELIDMIQSSVSSDHKISQILKLIHQNEQNYIKYQIKLQPPQSQLKQLLKNAVQLQNNDDFIQDPKQEVLKRLSNLKTIRDDYVKRQYENNTEEAIKEEMSREKKYQYRMFVEGLSAKQASPLQCKRKQNRNLNSSRNNKSTKQLQPQISTQKNNQKLLNPDSSKKNINYKSVANFNKNNLNSDKKDKQLNNNKNKSYNTSKSVVKINNTNTNANNVKSPSNLGKIKNTAGVKDANFSTNNTASTNKAPKLNNAGQSFQINIKLAPNSPISSPSNQLSCQNNKNNNLLKLQPVKQEGSEDKQLSKSKISTNNYLNTPQQSNNSQLSTPNRINKTFIDDISQSRMDKNTTKQPNQKESRYKYLYTEPNQPSSNSKDKDINKKEVYRYPNNISPLTSGGIPYHGAAHIFQKYPHQQITDNTRPYNYYRYPYIQHLKSHYYNQHQYQSQYRMPRRLQRLNMLNSSKPYTTNEYYYLQNDLRQYGKAITRDLNKNRLELQKKIQQQKQIDKYLKTNRNRQIQLERLKQIEEDIRKKQMAKILEQEREKSAERQKEREKERQKERELDRQLLWQRQKQRQLEIQKQKILKQQLQKQRQLELQLEKPYLSGLLNSSRRNQYKYLDISNQVDRNLNALGKNRQMYEKSVRSRKFI